MKTKRWPPIAWIVLTLWLTWAFAGALFTRAWGYGAFFALLLAFQAVFALVVRRVLQTRQRSM
jgi:hypothetical protein